MSKEMFVKESEMSDAEERLFALQTVCNEAWAAHKAAELIYFSAGSILCGKAWCDWVREYDRYNVASIALSKAYRAWNAEQIKKAERS